MVAQFLTEPHASSMEVKDRQSTLKALEISKGTVNVLMLSFTAKVTFI